MQALAAAYPGRFEGIACDLQQQSSIEAAAALIAQRTDHVDVLLNTAGVLGDHSSFDADGDDGDNGTGAGAENRAKANGRGPERSVAQVDRSWLEHTMSVNLIGHVMCTQALLPLLAPRKGRAKEDRFETSGHCAKVINLSARVGSVGDNRLGGWYSYRMSKSALNQFTRTLAVETKRHELCTVSMHPGTTITDLSGPFQKNVKPDKLFPVWYSVEQMLHVIWTLCPEQSGSFLAYDGSTIEW
jgi:NAD(P)-dependent dehydrogenase (short-subunit alcohol dehydrogenase family)